MKSLKSTVWLALVLGAISALQIFLLLPLFEQLDFLPIVLGMNLIYFFLSAGLLGFMSYVKSQKIHKPMVYLRVFEAVKTLLILFVFLAISIANPFPISLFVQLIIVYFVTLFFELRSVNQK